MEGEPGRSAVDPRLRVLGSRQAVEGRVDLDGVEARGVVAEAGLRRGDALGIPALDHGLVGPRARAHYHVSHGADPFGVRTTGPRLLTGFYPPRRPCLRICRRWAARSANTKTALVDGLRSVTLGCEVGLLGRRGARTAVSAGLGSRSRTRRWRRRRRSHMRRRWRRRHPRHTRRRWRTVRRSGTCRPRPCRRSAALGHATVAGAAAAAGAALGATAVVPAVAMLMLPSTTPAISAAITRAVTFLMLIDTSLSAKNAPSRVSVLRQYRRHL